MTLESLGNLIGPGPVATEGKIAVETSDRDLEPGMTLGRYAIVRKIGVGGMGAVYEATHLDLKKRVAVKTLLPAVAKKPELRARFVREGQAASQIRHPNAVDVSDVGVQDGVAYLVMEYLEGEDLAKVIKREGALPVDRIAEIMLPVMAAVMAAHHEGIVHRDLKPENIYLARTRDGVIVPKVLDFGISKMADPESEKGLTGTSALLGTPHYMAPEQVRGAKFVDARTDQYALGVILYESATGRVPFQGENLYAVFQAIVEGLVLPPRTYEPSLPPQFDSLVMRAMATSPDARFATVNALAQELLSFARAQPRTTWEPVFGTAVVATASTISQSGQAGPSSLAGTSIEARAGTLDQPRRTHPGVWIGAGIALACALVAGGVWLGSNERPPVPHTASVTSAAPRPTPVAVPPPATQPRAVSVPPSVAAHPLAPAAVVATPVPVPAPVVALPATAPTPLEEPHVARHRHGRRRGDEFGPEMPIGTVGPTESGTNAMPIVQ